MDANFSKFKKRVWLHILIKCLSIGLAVAAFAVNAVLTPCKLCGIDLLWFYYVLIGLGGFLIGGGVAFLCLKTNDKKIAMRLDSELGLQERVQTAYEFQGQTGAIYALQAVNTGVALGNVTKALPFKNIVATVLCGIVGTAGVTAVPPVLAEYVPVVFAVTEPETPPDVEPPREVTDWEWAALDELINYVRTSKKADSYTKSGMVQELQGLRNVLLDGVSQSTLQTFVQNTATNIRNVVKDANDRDGISEEQQTLNSEEENYVINRLYEIFSIKLPGDDDDNGDNNGDENKEPVEEDPSGPTNPGGLDLNDTPFFDPQKGYITIGEAMNEGDYYEKVQAALEEGTISREEWEEIMILYYQYLSANNKN